VLEGRSQGERTETPSELPEGASSLLLGGEGWGTLVAISGWQENFDERSRKRQGSQAGERRLNVEKDVEGVIG
jgi:hypothetical protein